MHRKYLALEQYYCNHSATTINHYDTTISVGVTAVSAVTPTFIVVLSAHHAFSPRFQEEERRCLSRGNNFLQQLRRSGVSLVRGEKVAAARTENIHTLTHRMTAIPSLL